MSEHTERVRRYVQELLGESGVSRLESASGSDEAQLRESAQDPAEFDDVKSGLRSVSEGGELSREQTSALEAIVLTRERPAVDILYDSYQKPPSPWRHLDLDPRRKNIEEAILSIGRVEIPNHPSKPFGGTAFVVGEDLLMTNRHVAETFSTGWGLKGLHFIPGRSPGIDFKQEVKRTPPDVIDHFDSVVLVHPWFDCALVKVKGLPKERKPLSLLAREPDELKHTEIVVIGYPAQDGRNDTQLQNRIFNYIFDFKRLQPGKIKGYAEVESLENLVTTLSHDSSTLGGNSGSVLLDPRTGHVLGLHFGGLYLESNYAVPMWALAADRHVRGKDLNFTQPPADLTTKYDEAWIEADRPLAQASQGGNGEPIVFAAGGGGSPSDFEWFERSSDAALKSALASDRAGTERRLVRVLGEEDARDLIEDLAPEGLPSDDITEGWFTKKIDPDLPEIVYLHGIMGSHLENMLGFGFRIWFHARSFVVGNVAERMTLTDNGFDDAHSGIRLAPDGHLKMKYGKAPRKWRKRGFAVHEFAYDWRKPVHASADQLHGFIEQLAAGNPKRRFALVAHSMGGLISSIYAARHSEWGDRVSQAVFVGSPLGGSYAPLEAVLGVYPFFKTLAVISRNDGIEDLQRLARTLPGLIEMLPHPGLFEGDPDYYASGTWHEGAPLQKWLDASRATKDQILSSPLLAETRGIVCRQYGTVGSARVEDGRLFAGPRSAVGDGTVPLRAAAIQELSELYLARGKRHADMMNGKGVIQAVGDLLEGGQTNAVERVQFADIDFDAVVVEKEAPMPTDESLAGIRSRIEAGTVTAADLEWIFEPLGGEPPQ